MIQGNSSQRAVTLHIKANKDNEIKFWELGNNDNVNLKDNCLNTAIFQVFLFIKFYKKDKEVRAM